MNIELKELTTGRKATLKDFINKTIMSKYEEVKEIAVFSDTKAYIEFTGNRLELIKTMNEFNEKIKIQLGLLELEEYIYSLYARGESKLIQVKKLVNYLLKTGLNIDIICELLGVTIEELAFKFVSNNFEALEICDLVYASHENLNKDIFMKKFVSANKGIQLQEKKKELNKLLSEFSNEELKVMFEYLEVM